jgi:hypothetical protein
MGVPPGNSSRGTAGLVSVPERYFAGVDTGGRQEGRPYPWSQQVIQEISGLRAGAAKLGRFKKISLKATAGFAIVAAQFLYEEALIWL